MKRATVWVHFNRFAARRGDSETWTVRTKGRNQYSAKVVVRVPLETIYRGDAAPQPRAYLKGFGRVTRRPDGSILVW